jgi:cell division protein FtsN
MLGGLVLGLLIAVGLYRLGDDGAGGGERPAVRTAAVPAAAPATAPRAAPGAGSEPATPRSAADPAAGDEPRSRRFDFYDILPQFEVVIPEVESAPRPDTEPVSVADPGSYVLQAGSFRSHGDADRMQASLALLGIESRIQTVTIDQDVYHRVRIGPTSDLDDLNRIRRQLRDARVEVLLMRVPE